MKRMNKRYDNYDESIAFRGRFDGEDIMTRARIHKTGEIYFHQGPVMGFSKEGTEFRSDDIVGLPLPELQQVLATAEDMDHECPYCGEQVDRFGLHRMQCIAEQVVEEQVKVIDGIADELEARDDVDDHLQDVIEQLRHCAKRFPNEMRNELTEEVEDE